MLKIRPEHTTDVFKLPPQDGALRLNKHLWWVPSHENNCNFTSWTTSLLFALQYALYKHRGAKNPSNLSQMSLLILDTRDFPKGTFIKDMEIMSVFAKFSSYCTCPPHAPVISIVLKSHYYFSYAYAHRYGGHGLEQVAEDTCAGAVMSIPV